MDSFGFNSVIQETYRGKSECLIFAIENFYKVSFLRSTYNPESNNYWTGMTFKFLGENEEYFYSLVKKKLVDWGVFDLSCTNIGRFDLYYSRKNTIQDKLSVGDFLEDCQRKLKQTKKNVIFEKNLN